MEPDPIALLRTVDPSKLGHRIRSARISAGLSQNELGAEFVTPGYVSRIEDGNRRPDLKVLAAMAGRLDVPALALLTGLSADERADIRARLDLGELSLSSDDAHSALGTADDALARLDAAFAPWLTRAARRLKAGALESLGDLTSAADELRHITDPPESDAEWVQDLISLSRCLRETGHLDEAVEVGETNLATVHDLGLNHLTAAIQLATTVAAAHTLRGDLGRATRLCKQAIDEARRQHLPIAEASARWNLSIILQMTGEADGALAMAYEALTAFEAGDDTRNLGRLRIHVANMLQAQTPPDPAAALALLDRARNELEWSSAGTVDVARHRLSTAYAHHALGDPAAAQHSLNESIELAPEDAQELRASQALLSGRIAAQLGNAPGAKGHYEQAVRIMSGIGADVDAAQFWFELGDMFTAIGEHAHAADAFRRAGASQGLHAAH